MKKILHLIIKPLTHIFNLSFQLGIILLKLKIEKIIPGYKSGNKSLPINYRPISLLPTFSKLINLQTYLNFYRKI